MRSSYGVALNIPTSQLELHRDLDQLLAAVRNNQTPDLETPTHSGELSTVQPPFDWGAAAAGEDDARSSRF